MEHGFYSEVLGAYLGDESTEVLYRCVNEIRENCRKSSPFFYINAYDVKRLMANRGFTVMPYSVKEAMLKVETGSGRKLFVERAPGVLAGERKDWDELYRAHTSGSVLAVAAHPLLPDSEKS